MSNYAHVFTPTAVEIIRSLADQGRSASEIADVLGSTPGSVRVKCCQFKIKLGRKRLRRLAVETQDLPKHKLAAHLSPSIYAALLRKARHKQKLPSELAEMLLDAVISSNIYKAVLDDSE